MAATLPGVWPRCHGDDTGSFTRAEAGFEGDWAAAHVLAVHLGGR